MRLQEPGQAALCGFSRSRKLGPWLRALWEQQPGLRDSVAEAAEQHAQWDAWRRALRMACRVSGVQEPAGAEWLPMAGGQAVVFQVGSAVLKFFTQVQLLLLLLLLGA